MSSRKFAGCVSPYEFRDIVSYKKLIGDRNGRFYGINAEYKQRLRKFLEQETKMTSLVGSDIAVLFSGGFFYSGINKCFTDKEQRDQHMQDVIAANFKTLIDNQNQTSEQLKAVVAAIENLDDTLNGKLYKMSYTLSVMSDSVNSIKANAGNIEDNTSKLTALQKSAKSIIDEISEISEGVGEVSKVNEALRELMNAMDNQNKN